jgi:hypothetical protein
MGTEAANQFTAAQIAAALGKAPQAVRRVLADVEVAGERMVRGNRTATWKIESLPESLQAELNTAAQARGLETIAALFLEAEPWQPKIPWRDVCPEQQAEALKLQRALLPILERHHSPILDNGELVQIGLRNYAREFAKQISPERFQYLFNRTVERDRNAEQFHRIELFLPGNLKAARAPRQSSAADAAFEPLHDCIARFNDPLKPTIDEVDALWQAAVELFTESSGDEPKKFKRRLLDYLWQRASFLAASWNALRVNLDRKVKLVRESKAGALALLDGRHLKCGETKAPAVPQDDVDRIAWHSARNCGGRTAQAVRELASMGDRSGLTKDTLDLITAPHANKSHVNRRLFVTVKRESDLIAPFLLGKKAIDDATPSLRRDYSKLGSMNVVTGDDFTMPVYCFVPDGKGWWTLTRGQCLLMIDVRSLKIIGWSLQPERNYNSLVIRTLMNRVCSAFGLPRVWLFERGIWLNSLVVKGAPREWREGKSDTELKPGWERLDVRFIHAKRARSKPAELVGGLLQNLMERMPGYCGRDERRDCPEITKRNKLAVDARRIEPHGLFLSFDAWDAELAKLIATYNAAVQQGEILKGTSPEAAFEANWPHDNPPTALDANCWHLLAHYVSEREVTPDGIKFRIGSETYIYRDENSSALRGRKVLAWFDPACPDLLGVTDLKERNPVLIRRDRPVDFLASLDNDGPSGRVYQEELAKVAGHSAYPRARFHVLKTKFEPSFRKNLVSPVVSDVAASFTSQRHERQATEQQAERTRSRATSRARKLGLPSGLVRNADDSTAAGLEMMARAERAMSENESDHEAVGASSQKTYHLDPTKTFKPKGKGK